MKFDEAVANHRKMWNWIADETLKRQYSVEKGDYYSSMGIIFEERPMCGCYCCAYVCLDCKRCPLKWTYFDGKPSLVCFYGGQYGRWKSAVDCNEWEEAARLAREIANLPERKRNEHDY